MIQNILFSIVSHGQEEIVQNLLKSIDKFIVTEDCSLKIIVTENLKKDINITSNHFNLEKTINLREKGFGNNHNCAFENSQSDFFFIINPDIEFIHTVNLNALIQEIEIKEIDICSPLIIDRSGDIEDYKRSDLTFFNLSQRKIFRKKESHFDWFAGMFLIVRSKSYRNLLE